MIKSLSKWEYERLSRRIKTSRLSAIKSDQTVQQSTEAESTAHLPKVAIMRLSRALVLRQTFWILILLLKHASTVTENLVGTYVNWMLEKRCSCANGSNTATRLRKAMTTSHSVLSREKP
jgi:hypothetical protein